MTTNIKNIKGYYLSLSLSPSDDHSDDDHSDDDHSDDHFDHSDDHSDDYFDNF